MPDPQPEELLRRIRNLESEAESWKIHHQLLMENFPDAVVLHDGEGRLLAANAAAARLTGFDREQLLEMNCGQLLTPESWSKLLGMMDRPHFSIETKMVSRNSSVLGVEVQAAVSRNAEGAVVVQYVAREAASQRRVEESLSHSETPFRLMAKNLTEMVLAYDMDRHLTFANAAAQSLTGYSPDELEARFMCWVHPEDRERMLGHWESLYQGKSFHEEEYRLITKDGRMKWVAASWAPTVDDSGRQVGVQGRERDVTAGRMAEETRRQSEHSLRINEERYRALFEDSPFPMWEEDLSGVKQYVDELRARGVTDLRRYLNQNREAAAECVRRVKVLDVNRAARQFYGVKHKEELLGDLTGLFDERAYETFTEEIAVLAETNSIYQTEFQVRRIRGDDRTVHMIVSVAQPSADWSRVVVSFFDITDRKRLEEQLLQSQKLESLGRLAGGIAHDFNNLLMIIAGYSDLLLNSLDKPEKLRHGLLEIKGAGERGAELTQQLLAFSRKQMTQPRIVSLNAIIQESQGLFERVIGEDIRLVISLDPAAWSIKADRGQMHQVLMNLVVNGRQAMPEGGVLTIKTGNTYLGSDFKEEPGGEGKKPYLRLRIQDTGVGMDERTRKHVFEPFFTTKGSRKGTGLGLATVFGIVTQSGGVIFVDSEPGRGATFSIYFPAIDSPAPGEAIAATVARKAIRGSGTILVVEDQVEVRLLTCAILRGLGFHVLEASDGMEAMLTSAEYRQPIRLLLTDVIMPGINGRELAARLAPSRPEMKVIFMSGYTDRIMNEDGAMEGSLAYLQKPFTPEMLTQMLQRVLGAG